MYSRPRFAGLLVALAICLPAAAGADQQYAVDGRDTFKLGGHDVQTDIAYSGTQVLRVVRNAAGATKFVATVDYRKTEGAGASRLRGTFAATVTRTGDVREGTNHDPDFLTVLNQPFAVQLDPATLRDLRGLVGSVPFDFPSAMTGATLHGTLTRRADGVINGARVLGIGFSATGPLHGALPDRPNMSIDGNISMNGTAYYDLRNALLVALDATLSIVGTVDDAVRKDAVSIVYKRALKPMPPTSTARR